MMKKVILLSVLLISSMFVYAQDLDEVEMTEEEMQLFYNNYIDSIEATFSYQTGEIILGDNIATINVPPGFKYVDGADGDRILTDIWGNPPSEAGQGSLGMLFRENETPLSDSSFGINITWSPEGYVDDEDAKDIDYDELLEGMQADEVEINELRTEMGYQSIHFVGWASPPFYDSDDKKLHWAKELKFGEAEGNTLNYSIRVLGRKGFLEMNIIGEMYVLPDVKKNINTILPSVNFTEGNRYADFNPDMDKVAAYGIGGLIAGKVLAKAGIFALLAKFWKLILIGGIAMLAGVKKFFGFGGDA